MTDIVVFVETSVSGELRPSAAELLTAAARLGSPVAVVVTTAPLDASTAADLGALGAATVFNAVSRLLTTSLTGVQTAALAKAVEQFSPAAVILSNTLDGRDIAGRLSARLGAAVLLDAVDLRLDAGTIVATHSVFGGAYLTESSVDSGLAVVTVRQASIEGSAPAAAGQLTSVEIESQPLTSGVIDSIDDIVVASNRPELRGAKTVVSGGRGLGSAEKFVLVEQLADALGGAVGASRAAVDAGYIPQSHQVGQTGITVSPQLYFALGISGAIQHRAGMQTAKTIVAINKDEDAPIFEIADFGVVGDVFSVVPQLIDALNSRKP
ncbi:MAG: electron transfer flavoprotein subunit alpha [Subtercola sp.]|nr:electron transfer flavoprotein subunit alpha [Subtercola sp.]